MNGLRKKRRKGMGIAELAVVIAVISIVSLIVVSFTLMVSDKVRNSREKVNAMNDITVIESIVDTWITENVKKEAIFEFNPWDGGSEEEFIVIQATLQDGSKVSIDFAGNTLSGILPDGNSLSYQTDTVTKITYDKIETKDDALFFCTITYQVAVSNSNSVTHTYTFVINPRVGDKVGA